VPDTAWKTHKFCYCINTGIYIGLNGIYLIVITVSAVSADENIFQRAVSPGQYRHKSIGIGIDNTFHEYC